jgi:hypothetical protein
MTVLDSVDTCPALAEGREGSRTHERRCCHKLLGGKFEGPVIAAFGQCCMNADDDL